MSKKVTVIVEGREYIVEVGDLAERPIRAVVNQKTYRVQVPSQSAQASLFAPPPAPAERAGAKPAASPTPAPVQKQAAYSAPAGDASGIFAPLPGNIVEVQVRPGDSVQPGDVVCVLEAMKMKNMIRSNRSGQIATVEVNVGQEVDHGAVLVTFE